MTSRARTAALALVGLAVAGPVLVASADARAAACPAGSWRATFFNSTTFGGGPVLSRCDAGVAFDWGTGRPGPGVRADGFTARWARTATFAAGTYTFTAAGDEGVRVKVDGTLVLNAWRTTPGRPVEASVRLAAGSHTVVVEHREATGAASVSASYRLASATPTSANLLSNPDLADGAPLPACFADGGYGQRPATGALSTDVPAGAAGRSWRIEQTAYVDGDAKLVSSDAPGCVGDLDPGATYTLGVSYRSSMPVNSLPLYAYRVGSGWSYWTTLTTLPTSAVWTRLTKPLPAVPAGVTKVAFGVAGEGNGVLFTTGYSLVRDTQSSAGLAQSGRWNVSSVRLPVRTVHNTLLRDGRVLLIAGSGNDPDAFSAGTFKTSVWNPTTNVFTDVPTPIDMFCAGHVTLADGRVLIAGGTTSYPNVGGQTLYKGAKASYVFDPATNRFSRVNDSAQGHWYPTLTKLGSGDVWMAGGQDENGTGAVGTEMYDAAGSRWKSLAEVPQSNQYWGGYPHMYLMADGRMFYAGGHTFGGPRPGTGASVYDWRTGGVADVPGLRDADLRDQAGSVLLPPAQNQRVLIAGGGYADLNRPPTNKADIIDLNAPAPAYRPAPDLPGPGRLYLNLTTLPDRTVLASNGAAGNRTDDVFAASIYHPENGTWQGVAADPVGRNYHSSAVLLPDGRVVVMGSNPLDGSFDLRVSIYEPPYQFQGTCPALTSAPTSAAYGSSISLGTTGAVVSAALTSPTSATHQTDTNARLVDLRSPAPARTRTATIPANRALLPPGPYMLTVLDNQNVPSVARWITVRGEAP